MSCFPIKIKDAYWSYGDQKVLNGINLSIQKGMFYSVIGPNGSGKTTLLKNIGNILSPMKNTIFLEEQDITTFSSKQIAQNLAVVPQNTEIDFSFTVFDIIMMGRTPYLKRFQGESQEDKQIVEDAMRRTNTWSLRNKKIDELSGGERQRVIMARAIAQKTDILLLDEPISHLDIQHQIELMGLIKQLNQQKQITVIAVLHDLNIAAEYSDTIILLHKGSVFAMDTPNKVLIPEYIYQVYGINVDIIKNPITHKPHIIPIYEDG
ncbi:MAG: heme ABC transporter ATP-binding protein [Epulopiscium sp.]|nr:heme ABC transporter ATP-binding protein [Candidatus Epulonipiscium sp.]